MSDSLDDLISALRSAALPNELEGMAAAVDAMHCALLPDLEPTVRPVVRTRSVRRRRASVAAVIASGVLGFAGVAAAGPGGFLTDDAPGNSRSKAVSTTTEAETTTTAPDTTVSPTSQLETIVTPANTASATTVTPTTGPQAAAAAASAELEASVEDDASTAVLVDDPDTDFDETQCAEGNHGRTVSSVAHATEPGPDHGAAVSEAAHSSCGKQDEAADDESIDDESIDDDVTESEADDLADGDESSDDPSNGHGHGSNGHGPGSDNGKNKNKNKD